MRSIMLTIVLILAFQVSLNAISYTESFNINDLSIRTNSRSYQEFRLADIGTTSELGNPELPAKVLSFIIPANQDACNLSASMTVGHIIQLPH